MSEVEDNVIDTAMIDLGDPSRPIARTTPGIGGQEPPPLPPLDLPPGAPEPVPVDIVVAFGDAIGDDWVGHGIIEVVRSQRGVTRAHQDALEWFRQRLAAHHGSQGDISNKNEIP